MSLIKHVIPHLFVPSHTDFFFNYNSDIHANCNPDEDSLLTFPIIDKRIQTPMT
jgi:hypothetical protein